MRDAAGKLGRVFSGSRSSGGSGEGGRKIRLDRSWAFYGIFLFLAAGFFPGSPARGLFSGVVLGVATLSLGFLTALLHEFGHRLAARFLKVPYDGGRLSFWGGFPRDRIDFGPPTPSSIVVRLAGPAVNVFLWQAGLALLSSSFPFPGGGRGSFQVFFPEIAYLLQIFTSMNALVAVLNLFPGLPFDMGVVVALVFCRASGKERPGEGSLPERIGWAGGFAASLFGLFLVTRGMAVSGFGGVILGYLVLGVLMHFRENNRIGSILEEVGLEPWLRPVEVLARDDMWVQEVILGPMEEAPGETLPVISAKDGLFRGELSWEDLRSRPFPRWEGVRLLDLERLSPGSVIDIQDGPSRILEVLGERPGGAPVVRNGRLAGWLSLGRIRKSAMISAYIDSPTVFSNRPPSP